MFRTVASFSGIRFLPLRKTMVMLSIVLLLFSVYNNYLFKVTAKMSSHYSPVIAVNIVRDVPTIPHPKKDIQPAPVKIKCQFPKQDPYDPEIVKVFKKYPDVDCKKNGTPSLVNHEGNFLRLNTTKANILNITVDHCSYLTITLRNRSDYEVDKSQWSKPFTNEIEIDSGHENIVVKCYHGNITVAESYITRIVKKTLVEETCERNYKRHLELNSPKETLSVLLVGMDGNSRQNSLRFMPKTRDFLLFKMNAIELYKFNKVGINTWPNVVPFLTGFHVDEFEEHGWSRGRYLNDVDHLFAWHAFKQAGYRTAFMLDDKIDTGFHYAKKSWHSSPFDYYNRPMVVIKNASDCVGDTPEISFLMDYWVQLATTFNNTKSKPYFVFSFSKRITHDDFNGAAAADQLYTDFFQKLVNLNVLNNTVVVFFSDHGPRFGPIRQTKAGHAESRTPMFFFMFPPWFHTKYPSLISAFRTNQHRLTTHFDVHATLKDLLYFKGETGKGNLSTRGISLFKEIPADRVCRHAGVPESFCFCSQQIEVQISPDLLKKMSNVVLQNIINKTKNYRNLCDVLRMRKIKSVVGIQTDDKCKTCTHYQINVSLMPGNRVFESLVQHDNKTNTITVLADPVLLTMYRKTADCVGESMLKSYCYCKKKS